MTRPYMNNETLTRKQNQKPCDLTNTLLQLPWSAPCCPMLFPARQHARMRVVGGFLEPHARRAPVGRRKLSGRRGQSRIMN